MQRLSNVFWIFNLKLKHKAADADAQIYIHVRFHANPGILVWPSRRNIPVTRSGVQSATVAIWLKVQVGLL
jgi:hypothetical protein